jgi:hypothetical protein
MIASVIGTFVSMSHDFHSLRHASTWPNKRGARWRHHDLEIFQNTAADRLDWAVIIGSDELSNGL